MRVLTHADLDVPSRLTAAFDKVIRQVESDDLRSCDMKKLGQRGRFYRAKLDYDARLLFTFGTFGGVTVAFALEVIEKHAYERSRFLRGAVVDAAKLDDDTGASTVEPEPLAYLHDARTRFHYLDKPLTFDDTQDALYRHAPPLVLVGAAGSGKTAVLLEKLRALSGAGPVAYVTHSAWLAEAARGLFGPGREDETASCEFLSFRGFLESVKVPDGRPVTARDFAGFFARHASKLKGTDAHACFEEIRGVLGADPKGTLSLEAYLALGPRKSLYTPDVRPQVYAVFERYLAWLPEAHLYDTNLVAHAYAKLVQPTFDALVIDEVQDFTNAELSLLLASCKRRDAFVLSGDAHQIVHPNLFSWSNLKAMFFSSDALEKGDIAFLSTSYRNSRAVTSLANRLLKVKWARFGSIDRESNTLTRAIAEREGSVRGLTPTPQTLAELADKVRRSTRAAVIVLRDEQKADAAQVYGTPLVFSVHEAKGLEYETVILHKMIGAEAAAYGSFAEGITPADLERDDLDYRRAKDKGDKSLEAFKFFANALYVAITRAVDSVVLVEDEAQHPLLALVGVSFSEGTAGLPKVTSTVEEWQREARSLELRGKTEQAEAIQRTVLKIEPVPWTVVDGEAYEELCRKALEPGSVSRKAREQLLDYACMHINLPLTERLLHAGFAPAKAFGQRTTALYQRTTEAYRRKNPREVLEAVEKYGIEHRSTAGLTPLMLAAKAGNASLARALIERGASRTACDPYGRTAMHYAIIELDRYDLSGIAEIAETYHAVALDAVDLRVDGRLIRLLPHQAEFLHLAVVMARYTTLFAANGQTTAISRSYFVAPEAAVGFEGAKGVLNNYPESLCPEYRRAASYINAALARNERDGTARPNRKLWRRRYHGEYAVNDALAVRYGSGEDAGEFVPIEELLGKPKLVEHMAEWAKGIVDRSWIAVDGGTRAMLR